MNPPTVQTYLAVGPFAWGKATTRRGALNRMRVNVPSYVSRPYTVEVVTFACPPNAVEITTGIGLSWSCPPGAQLARETMSYGRARR